MLMGGCSILTVRPHVVFDIQLPFRVHDLLFYGAVSLQFVGSRAFAFLFSFHVSTHRIAEQRRRNPSVESSVIGVWYGRRKRTVSMSDTDEEDLCAYEPT
jgi:hypothetical protein